MPVRERDPETSEARALLATAEAAAAAGAAVLEGYFRSGKLEVATKAANDFVTQADRESERTLVDEILRRHPDHAILAEEGTEHPEASADVQWVIDPLDGTTNFLHGLPVWAVSVACRRGDRWLAGVVLDPCGGNRFTASRGGGAHWNGRPMRVSARPGVEGSFLATGYPFRALSALDLYLELFRSVLLRARAIRRCGAAALDLAYTAAGVYDGFFELRLSIWDIAAGALLIEEAGGVLTDLGGAAGWVDSGNVLAGAPGVHADLLDLARAVVSEERIDRLVPR